jgi:hypothetical protein
VAALPPVSGGFAAAPDDFVVTSRYDALLSGAGRWTWSSAVFGGNGLFGSINALAHCGERSSSVCVTASAPITGGLATLAVISLNWNKNWRAAAARLSERLGTTTDKLSLAISPSVRRIVPWPSALQKLSVGEWPYLRWESPVYH